MTPPHNTELRKEIGQLIVMGFDGTEMSSGLEPLITRVRPGGVVLFARNIATPLQTYELLKSCQRLVSTPMFLCVDMEGGLVDRLKKAISTRITIRRSSRSRGRSSGPRICTLTEHFAVTILSSWCAMPHIQR